MSLLSPNFEARRGRRTRPSLVVLHYTGMDSAAASLSRLCEPAAKVSAHWLIDCDGRAVQLVHEAMRAWHAGAGSWGDTVDVNSHSIGIELQNRGNHPFPEPQMAALEQLLRDIMTRWSIRPAGVIAHSDMAPGRKADPGARFDWARLVRQGLAIGANIAMPIDESLATVQEETQFFANLKRFGYGDFAAEDVLVAFRLRFRPWGQGALRRADCMIAADLVTR